jgi:hypothetical protein
VAGLCMGKREGVVQHKHSAEEWPGVCIFPSFVGTEPLTGEAVFSRNIPSPLLLLLSPPLIGRHPGLPPAEVLYSPNPSMSDHPRRGLPRSSRVGLSWLNH